MTNIDSFCTTGVRECAVAFAHARHALGQGNTEKYSTSSCRYAGECVRINENVASYQHGGGAVLRQWKLPKKISRGQCDCLQMFFMGTVKFIKVAAPEVVEYRWK